MDIEKVLVVGAGTMGSGIAQVCAESGLQVVLSDKSGEALSTALQKISWSVDKFIEKGKLTEDKETIVNRIQTAAEFSDAWDADAVIEAVFENQDLKKELFKALDRTCKPEAYIFSNTSAIPITELAAVTRRADKVAGLHFFNPVPMMPAVEVIRGLETAESTLGAGVALVLKLGKTPIQVNSDLPGFLLNRINLVSYVEAIRLLEQGVGTVSDIDNGIRLGFGRKMGPFETGDMVGLDVSYGALCAIYEDSKEMRFHPPQLLKRKVAAGHLGRKTGRGWYVYHEDGTRTVDKQGYN
jgi:3-hydroxybutyryl-CoA dehydrogenase